MKRILTNLKAYASVAMAIAVLGVASLGMSCQYDDTAINEKIEGVADDLEGVKGDLAALEERVAKLETKLNNEVAGLQALIVTSKDEILAEVNGKFTTVTGSIEDLEEKYAALAATDKELAEQLKTMEANIGKVITAKQNSEGAWVLTLSDGKEITVYPQSKTVYHGVTVLQQNGVYYWAQYNADGTTSFLKDAEGNMYPLHHATPEVDLTDINNKLDDIDGVIDDAIAEAMADIQLRVNEEGVTEMTINGGETWVEVSGQAGIFASAEQDVEAGTATFTLAGGETIVVPLAKEAEPEMVFGIKGGKVYFENDEVKNISIASDLVKDIVILQQPEGWGVECDGKKLTVTAPSYADIFDTETAVEEGVIKILATDGTGAAIVSKVTVSASEVGIFLTVDAMAGTFDITNNMTVEDMGQEYPMPYYYSVMKASDFDVDAMKEAIANYEMPPMVQDSGESYEDMSIAEVYGELYYEYDEDYNLVIPEMVPGETYVIWVAPHSMVTYSIDLDAISYVEYTYATVDCELVSATFSDIVVDVEVSGYDGYYMKYYDTSNNEYAEADFNEWTSGMSYWPWADLYKDEGFEGSIFEIIGGTALPNTTYHIYILPYTIDKAATDYTWDEVRHFEVKTTGFTAGGEGAPTFVVDAEKTTYTSLVGTLTPAAGTLYTYYRFYTAEELAAFADDAALTANLLNIALDKTNMIDEEGTVRQNNLNPGDSRTLVAISVTAEGVYGDLIKVTASTNTVTVGAVAVSIDDTEAAMAGYQMKVKISVTGGEAVKYRYELVDKSQTRWSSKYKATLEGISEVAHGQFAIVTDDDYYVKTVAAADFLNEYGWATFNVTLDKNYVLLVAAVDADGNVGAIDYVEFTPTFSGNVITKYLEDGTTINPVWEAGKPTVVMEVTPGGYSTDVAVTVTPGTGATLCLMGKFYVSSAQLPTAKVKNMMSGWVSGGCKALTGPYSTGSFTSTSDTITYSMSNKYHIHIMWQDAEGNLYEPYCVEWSETAGNVCE